MPKPEVAHTKGRSLRRLFAPVAIALSTALGAGTAFADPPPRAPEAAPANQDIPPEILRMMGVEKKSAAPDDRVIRLNTSIDQDVAEEVSDRLRELDATAPGVPIELRINSGGGGVADGLMIFDTMKSLHSPVATVCESACYSMAAVLLAGGTPGMRSALPNATVMIHELSGGIGSGKYSDLKGRQKLMDMLQDKLVTVLSDYSGHTKAELSEIMRTDTFYSADEALKMKFIDSVGPVRQHAPGKEPGKAPGAEKSATAKPPAQKQPATKPKHAAPAPARR